MILREPLLEGLHLGSPEWFAAQRRLILTKPLLRYCYDTWYRKLLDDAATVPSDKPGILLELGSGGSLLAERCPDVVTSDVVPGVAAHVIDARALPFEASSVRAIFLTHALHHIPHVERFFAEAERVLVRGGVVSMIEVSHTPFARQFFSRFHPEPYDDRTLTWDFSQADTMADSNQALSWLAFVRDRARFESDFPSLRIEVIDFLPWFSYLAAGGVTRRALVPGWASPVARAIDRLTRPASPLLALHWHIRLRRV